VSHHKKKIKLTCPSAGAGKQDEYPKKKSEQSIKKKIPERGRKAANAAATRPIEKRTPRRNAVVNDAKLGYKDPTAVIKPRGVAKPTGG